MSSIITEAKAMEIVREFSAEICHKTSGIIAIYIIGSLGGGYYRPGQSDIDTIIIAGDDAAITQKQTDEIANKYHEKYSVPKGFGAIMIRLSELSPPYHIKSEAEDFEFTIEIARLKTQGKAVYGTISLDEIAMPTPRDFITDAIIMEKWFAKEFGYPMFDKLQITGCINCILGYLRRYMMIERGVFEFNKFQTIEMYMRNEPPIVDMPVFDFIEKYLHGAVIGSDDDLPMLRKCGVELRELFNRRRLNLETGSMTCCKF